MTIIEVAKKAFLILFALLYEKYTNHLKEEQEFIGILSDMLSQIYVMESALVRSLKMLNKKDSTRTEIALMMTKVLFYQGLDQMRRLAREALEGIEIQKRKSQAKYFEILRVLSSPPTNVVRFRRDIANAMIRYGHY